MPRSPKPVLPRTNPNDLGRDPEVDAVTSLGEAFGEAAEHVARDPKFRSVRLGPTVELPMSRLWPGELGWERSFTGPGTDDGASLLVVLLPGSARGRRAAEIPLPETSKSEYRLVEVLSGPPWRIVAARARPGARVGPLREFARAVARELRSG
jgi:hypothetical protein